MAHQLEQPQRQPQLLPLLALQVEHSEPLALHEEQPQLLGVPPALEQVQPLRRLLREVEPRERPLVLLKEERRWPHRQEPDQVPDVKEVRHFREPVPDLQPVVRRLGCHQLHPVQLREPEQDLPKDADEEPRLLLLPRWHPLPEELFEHPD